MKISEDGRHASLINSFKFEHKIQFVKNIKSYNSLIYLDLKTKKDMIQPVLYLDGDKIVGFQ